MRTYQTVLPFLLAGLVAGWVCGMLPALDTIRVHEYWQTGMYGLAAEQVMRHLPLWMGIGGIVFALCGLITALCARVSIGLRAAACAIYIGLLCACLYYARPYLSPAAARCAVVFVILPCALLCLPRVRRGLLDRKNLIGVCVLPCLLILLCASAWFAVNALRTMSAGPSFVVIVIDCLRPDHLGCHGYGRDTSPTIDALARVGRHYEQAYVTAPWTKPSVASLFTSLLPARHGLINSDHTASDRMVLLAEVLRNAGYTNLFINGGNVFLKKEFNLHQGFHRYDYLPHGAHSASDTVRVFLERVARLGGKKYFAYLHFMDAHAPYTVNRHNTRYAPKIIESLAPGEPATLLTLQREPDAPCNRDLRQYFVDLYDGQIRYIDEAIGGLLHGLTLLNRQENTVFIITADHGEEFWDHGSADHGHSLYNELLHVPLIIAGSPVRPARVTAPVQLIDIMPTVLDLAGVSRERLGLQGVSLIPGTSAAVPDRTLYASATLYGPETWCIIQNSSKLIYRSRNEQDKWSLTGPQAPEGYQFFDLGRDPAEQDDRIGADGLPLEMESRLADYIRTEPLPSSGKSILVGGDDLRQQLESLGYIQ